ncbi:MAG: hypothetical protein Q4C58_01405 [Eubacteriales bacterium]|nr:hypothetical protein [Eubacteriales bacterium]
MKYNGIYIRDNFSDQGTIPSGGASPTYSPDVICYQNRLLSPIDAKVSYDRKPSINMPFLHGSTNNIYIRGKNIADTALKGKAKAFCAPYNVLYMPPRWQPLSTIAGDREVQLVAPVTGTNGFTENIPSGEIAVVAEPFELDYLENPKMHTCIMGLLTNNDGESYIDLPQSFSGDAQLWEFLRQNPQIAYNNIKVEELSGRISSHTIEFGNHDADSRKFILSIHVEEGAETLDNTKVLVQSPNAAAPFTYEFFMKGSEEYYSIPYVLGGKYSGHFNLAFTMPDYTKVHAAIHVSNLAVNIVTEDMIPDVSLAYQDAPQLAETATSLGDCYIYLGMENDGNSKDCVSASGRNTCELPILRPLFSIG